VGYDGRIVIGFAPSPDRDRGMDRLRAALAAAAVQLLFGVALFTGLGVGAPGAVQRGLSLFDVVEIPPPPPPPPPRVRQPTPRRAGQSSPAGGSPPNLRSTPTEIVLPPPLIALQLPPPLVAAPVAGTGSDASAGAADVPGPGTGSGGRGRGSGTGDGDGDGDGGMGTPPRHLRGRLRDSDYPRGLGEAGIEGIVAVRYAVAVDGRVSDCVITHSSGSAVLDETTCRLIEQRFRFSPSRDAAGRPVRSFIVENHSWIVHDEPPEPPR
jgi:periplasmic protein TonB